MNQQPPSLCAQAWQTAMSLLHVCGHLLEQTQAKTSHATAVCDIVAAVVQRYAKTPLVMKTVLQARCCAPCVMTPPSHAIASQPHKLPLSDSFKLRV